MEEVLNSFWEWFKEKTTSPLYATYIVCFVVENWRIFFTLFFQDGTVLQMPKVEYIHQNFFGDHGWWLILNYAKVLLIPAISTYVIIRLLPPVVMWAHKLNVKHYFERKKIYDDADLLYEKQKKVELEELAVVKTDQASAIKKIEASTPKEENWDKEIRELRSQLREVHFDQAIRHIYEESGWVHSMPQGTVAFGDVHGLLDFSSDRSKVFLTPKGKYFAKKLLT